MIFRRPEKKVQTVTVQIEGNVQWMIGFDPDSAEWIGVCNGLNLNASGETFQDCVLCATEAMALLFEDLFVTSELDAFLRRNGWGLKAPTPAPGTKVRFDIPFTLAQASVDQVVAAAH